MNRKIVRKILNHYTSKGERRIDELFGEEREGSIGAFFGRMPVQFTLNRVMNRMGVNEEMKSKFFQTRANKQTVKNLMKTIANNGMKHPFRFEAPMVVVWNYTNLCNLRCRYCYQSAGKHLQDELSFEEKIDLLNQMVEANVAFIAFSGGEPVMGERFFDILSYACKFFHTSIASNGTFLRDRQVVKKLADCGVRNIFVTLDGATAESHDFIRGNGSFRKS
jgi:sulfatase maturation enzyme AslB (radical SAM superfamily)